MLNLSSCDYSDAYILIKGTITREGLSELTKQQIEALNKYFLKLCSFTDSISKISNMQIDNV